MHTQSTFGDENTITAAKVLAVKILKAAGCNEIRPEMLEALKQGIIWLTHVCQVAWCSVIAPKDWQTGVIIPIQRETLIECWNRTYISSAFQVYAKCHAKRWLKLNQSWRIPSQCSFCPGRSTTDQIFTPQQIWEICQRYLHQLCPTQMAYWAKNYVTILTRSAHWIT